MAWHLSRFAAATPDPNILLMLRSCKPRNPDYAGDSRRASGLTHRCRVRSRFARICDSAQNRFRPWPDRPQRGRGRAASKAGIVEVYVLLSVDGTLVNSLEDLTAVVNAAAPRHSVEFDMSRDAKRNVTILL
jgi:hypothetical protein